MRSQIILVYAGMTNSQATQSGSITTTKRIHKQAEPQDRHAIRLPRCARYHSPQVRTLLKYQCQRENCKPRTQSVTVLAATAFAFKTVHL